MAFFKKEPTKQDQLQQKLRTWLMQHAGQEIALNDLNEYLYQNDIFTLAYFAEVGFQAPQKQVVQNACISKNAAQKIAAIKESDFNHELTTTKEEKSILNGIITSDKNYFRLYVTPSSFQVGCLLLAFLPETNVYQADKKTGAFVLNTIKELLYLCYRFDLAQHPQLAAKNLPLMRLDPPSVTQPILTTLTAIQNKTIAEINLQYLFTWVLQYSATITATSTLFAAYSSATLPSAIQTKTQAIITELSANFASSATTLTETTEQDSLAMSAQLLEQIPHLFQDANQKMMDFNQQLQEQAEKENQ
ncbi:hypothetical protein EsVE80_25830 [Enterococcus saigonensis]|uniref:Uncharacterized protein n=1 Tax=Enterococcus saigonensis TaxID=1805431 RepID=A0A679IFF4_9ENTE|nr:hypothetical protein [Enterococcus saigonensis]BCA87060.1 hypothetical protein EsVE80_25830 [Enterococcus saigonensis]